MAGIPQDQLRCTICPKEPQFSDVSHLLTHLGSKGHLSSENKVVNLANAQAVKIANAQARNQTRLANNQARLANNQPAPGNRPAHNQPEPGNRPVNNQPRLGSNQPELGYFPINNQARNNQPELGYFPLNNQMRPANNPPEPNNRPANNQPRLGNNQPEIGYFPVNNQPAPGNRPVHQQPEPNNRPVNIYQDQLDRFYAWKKTYNVDRMLGQRASEKERKRMAQEEKEFEEKRTRREERKKAQPVPAALAAQAAGFDQARANNQPAGRRPVPSTPTRQTGRRPAQPPANPDASSESSEDEMNYKKLKGAKFPGMGMFDAASEGDRKKRNQRKDGSVVEKMRQASEQVEPTEMVFYQGLGGQPEAKDIYRSPTPPSPEDSEEELQATLLALLKKGKKLPKPKVLAKVATRRPTPGPPARAAAVPPRAEPEPEEPVLRYLPQPMPARQQEQARPRERGPIRIELPQNRYNMPRVRQQPRDRHHDCDDEDDVFYNRPATSHTQGGNLANHGFGPAQGGPTFHPRRPLGGLDTNANSFYPTPAVRRPAPETPVQAQFPARPAGKSFFPPTNRMGGTMATVPAVAAVPGATGANSFLLPRQQHQPQPSSGFFPTQEFDFSAFAAQGLNELAQAQQAPAPMAMHPMAESQVGQAQAPIHPLYQQQQLLDQEYNDWLGSVYAEHKQADQDPFDLDQL